MEEKVLSILNQLLEGQKETNERLERVEKKLDAVVDQTADLTEFRTEVKGKLEEINTEVKGLRKDITAVELVTSKNWNDIATLKAIK